MRLVWLKPVALQSRVKHSTTEPLRSQYIMQRHRKLFNTGRGGQVQRGQLQYLGGGGGGGGILQNIHTRMHPHISMHTYTYMHMCMHQ